MILLRVMPKFTSSDEATNVYMDKRATTSYEPYKGRYRPAVVHTHGALSVQMPFKVPVAPPAVRATFY
jgi:hypothetical protein